MNLIVGEVAMRGSQEIVKTHEVYVRIRRLDERSEDNLKNGVRSCLKNCLRGRSEKEV